MKICPKCKRACGDQHMTCNVCGTELLDYYVWEKSQNQNNSEKNKLQQPIQQQYQPHCPICGSPNVEKISTASKVGKAALFGVFSLGSIGKTYKCKSCGAKF